MRSLFPVTVCCISLLSLQQQLLALPTGSRLERNRLAFVKRLQELGEGGETFVTGTTDPFAFAPEAKREWRKHRLSKKPPPRPTGPGPAPSDDAAELKRRGKRGRRHAHNGARGHSHHHPQLMRVGCVLGTCQVQNLSHRLYQLIGQSGREDSSPINPRSPHSYG